MADVRVEIPSSFYTQALTSQDMQDAMVKVAEDGGSHAESIAPVDSGHYKRSFVVEPAEFTTTKGGRRKGATLTNTADHAAAVEWEQGRHVLGQTLAKLEADHGW